jgi:hypothetical protein
MGGTVQGMDIRMPKVRVVRLRGRVDNQTGNSVAPISVSLSPADAPSIFVPARAAVGSDGTFEFRDVAPGKHLISAEMTIDSRAVRGSKTVETAGEAVDNIAITLMNPQQISGRIRVESAGSVELNPQALTVTLRPPGAIIVGKLPISTRPVESGNFALGPVNPGRYSLIIDSLPTAYYLKSARLGTLDIKEDGLELWGVAPGALEVVLRGNAGALSGSVKDDRGQPAARATVVLVPELPNRRLQAEWFKSTITDAVGDYSLAGLT